MLLGAALAALEARALLRTFSSGAPPEAATMAPAQNHLQPERLTQPPLPPRTVYHPSVHIALSVCGDRGRAMQVDPIEPQLRPPGSQRLKVNCDVLLSTSAFKLNLRCYIVATRR